MAGNRTCRTGSESLTRNTDPHERSMLILVKCRGESEFGISLLRFTENLLSDFGSRVQVLIFPEAYVPNYFGCLWQPSPYLAPLTEWTAIKWKALARKRFRLFPHHELDPVRYIQLVKCLSESACFTAALLEKLLVGGKSTQSPDIVQLVIATKYKSTVDFLWYRRLLRLVNNFIHLYETMAWLSTLGGAYSAMGDYNYRYAMVAKKISVEQLKLAISYGDPSQVCRCWIFIAMSAMQYGKVNYSKKILLKQWRFLQSNQTCTDPRLKSMILGTWERLKHERAQRKQLLKS